MQYLPIQVIWNYLCHVIIRVSHTSGAKSNTNTNQVELLYHVYEFIDAPTTQHYIVYIHVLMVVLLDFG